MAKIEDDSIVISSLGPNGEKTERKYEFKEDEVILVRIKKENYFFYLQFKSFYLF